jgi:hypothetical protein
MERFSLRAPTTAVSHQAGDEAPVRVMIPAGSERTSDEPLDRHADLDRSRLATVKWAVRTVEMFLSDLIERGERIYATGE